MGLPHIVITSFLGKSEIRKHRLGFHLEQRRQLVNLFPKLSVMSLCSDYTESEKQELAEGGFDAVHIQTRRSKPEWHNRILRRLYNSPDLSSILLLDDDVVPDTELENIQEITHWLQFPCSSPGPCVFFSTRGLIYDFYTNNRQPGIRAAPPRVVGWAIFVRSDLGVFQDQDTIEAVDDLMFRVKCAAEGKRVLKHYSFFFKALSSNKHSTIAEGGQKQRREGIQSARELLLKKYPRFFHVVDRGGKKKLVCKLPRLENKRGGFFDRQHNG